MFAFGRQDAHEVFVKNLAELMQEEQFDIELILLTHLHFDHFGGVRGLLQHFCTFGQQSPSTKGGGS